MALGPEAKVKKECRAYLKSIGAYVFSPVQMGYGAATVDDLVCMAGVFAGIEYKRPEGGKLTERQKRCLDEIWHAGGRTVVVCSVEELRLWATNNFVFDRGSLLKDRDRVPGRVSPE